MDEFEFMPPYRIGNEASAFVNNSKLFERLTDAIGKLRTVGNYDPASCTQSGIAKIVYEETGVSIMFKVAPSNFKNAFAYVPDLDRNNPIMSNFIRGWKSNADLHKVLNFTGNNFNGLVDKTKGRVDGDFSKIVIPAGFTKGLLEDKTITDRQLAEVLGHEIGHYVSYCERLIDLVSINYAAAYTAERVLKLSTNADRIKLVSEYEKEIDTVLADKETIVSSESGEAIYTHLVLETIRSRRNAEGNQTYSHRGFEYSADQFVTRHGGGLELAKVITRLAMDDYHSSIRSWPGHLIIQMFTALIFGGFVGIIIHKTYVITGIITALILLATGNDTRIYDDPEERIKRMRNDLVASLKETADKETHAFIVRDIRAMDTLLENVKDKLTWHEAIWNYMVPKGIKDRNAREFQQDLEKIMNNDLFVAAATLDTLSI